MSDGNAGYIPLFRKFFDHYLWTEDREFSKAEAWLDCIQMARYKKSKTKKLIGTNLIEWGYGQFPASVRYLKERWKWKSNTKVENFLSLLESDDMIKIEKGQGQNVITLCNYSNYDFTKNSKKTDQGQTKDTERTPQGHREDAPRTDQGRNSKKGNKGNKGNKGKQTEGKGSGSGKVGLSGFEDRRDKELEMGDVREWMEKNNISISGDEFDYELDRFRDTFSEKRKIDWIATFRNYLRSRYLDTEHFDFKRNEQTKKNKRNHAEGNQGEYTRDPIREIEESKLN